VSLDHRKIVLHVPNGAPIRKRREVLDRWYRSERKAAIQPLIAKWEKRLGLRVDRFFVQKMKTKWGGSNPKLRTIRLNLELVKKPEQCLDYVILHEMLHFLVPNHSERFFALIEHHMPNWRIVRQSLNETPLGHAEWLY
jgi:predicted metal-dependent hydrolase